MKTIRQADPHSGDVDHVDGRTMRRTRNRSAVIAALLDMVREGDLEPAAADVAERAGVSHRSVFRYFDDLQDLARTAVHEALTAAGPLIDVPNVGVGTLDVRIDALVDRRIALYDSVDGPMQLARVKANAIPAIEEEIGAISAYFRSQLRDHFGEELAAVPTPEREFVLDAVLVLTSYDAYVVHTRRMGSSHDRMRASWAVGLRALLSH